MSNASAATERIAGSFRDPSGFLFTHDGAIYRQVNAAYAEHYDRLMQSGLYDALTRSGSLVAHEEVSWAVGASAPPAIADAPPAWKIIRPERVPFISYPYEWSFGQLKAAALLTLDIQRRALEKGLVLRDASAYNVQFLRGKPIFIDTLSFGPYAEGEPWVAYQQFCKHFLAPLALMAKIDVGLSQLMRVHIDGVPLELASKLLPFGTKLHFGLATHLHLHAKSSQKWANAAADDASLSSAKARTGVSKTALLGQIDSLQSTISGLDWSPGGTEWGDYYASTNYTEASHQHKKELVGRFVGAAGARVVWDLGANTGVFSRIAAEAGAQVISFDIDPAAVERNWREVSKAKETRILPLLQDFTNPSTGIGWDNDERASLADRGPAEMLMALALIHHIAISNNVPLPRIARALHRLCSGLIIEFVPKEDSQVRRLLATREDIFPDYTLEGFEAAFAPWFSIADKEPVRESHRTLYRMVAR
jgi:ribosomal protein L11 methylase PrmA